MFNSVKVIGFDLDQTLYTKSPEIDDAIQGYIYQKISEHKNCSIQKAEKLFSDLYKGGAGLSGRKTLIELGIPNAGDIVQEALESDGIEKFLVPKQEVIELLKGLKENYPIDIITGSHRNNTLKKLGKLQIPESYFSHIVTADDATKSDGEAYKLWMSYYKNLSPKNFIYVGDRPSDYLVPSELGIQSVLINIKNPDKTLECKQLPNLLDIRNLFHK